MKNILTAAMTAFLVLFASVGCDDKDCDNATETVAPVDSADVATVDHDVTVESDSDESGDTVESSDVAAQSEGDVESSDLDSDSDEGLPSDATATSEPDSE